MAGGQDDPLVALLERQIQATDRVNHAVRAIVIPSLILLVATLLASPLLLVGFFVPYFEVFLFPAGIILLVGAIWAIVIQIKESELTAIPSGSALDPKELKKSRRMPDWLWKTLLVSSVLLGVVIFVALGSAFL